MRGVTEAEHRFCPWCATPQRRKLVEFFVGTDADAGRAHSVCRATCPSDGCGSACGTRPGQRVRPSPWTRTKPRGSRRPGACSEAAAERARRSPRARPPLSSSASSEDDRRAATADALRDFRDLESARADSGTRNESVAGDEELPRAVGRDAGPPAEIAGSRGVERVDRPERVRSSRSCGGRRERLHGGAPMARRTIRVRGRTGASSDRCERRSGRCSVVPRSSSSSANGTSFRRAAERVAEARGDQGPKHLGVARPRRGQDRRLLALDRSRQPRRGSCLAAVTVTVVVFLSLAPRKSPSAARR